MMLNTFNALDINCAHTVIETCLKGKLVARVINKQSVSNTTPSVTAVQDLSNTIPKQHT